MDELFHANFVDYRQKNTSMLRTYWIVVGCIVLMEWLDPVLHLLGVIRLPGGLWPYFTQFILISEGAGLGCGLVAAAVYRRCNASQPGGCAWC